MEGSDHTTRTLLIPRNVDGMLVIARGSTSNVDPQAEDQSSGISTVKAFNVSSDVPGDGYEHATSGVLLGWGLRNEVGIVEHPVTGAIYGVENSVDQLERDGKDIHSNNPAEELNFLGYLNGTKTEEQGTNFGYPKCLTAWRPSEMPANANIQVGTPFADTSSNDSSCDNTTAPRLAFQAHTAPLDIKFNDTGSEAWVSFHGSWNRDAPVGYSVAKVMFNNATGMPEAVRNSTDAAEMIFSNQDNSACPKNCFRPVGMAFDGQGRMFVASDASGEIYVVRKAPGSNGTASNSGGSGGPETSGGSGGASPTGHGDDTSSATRSMLSFPLLAGLSVALPMWLIL
jgi:glucose/arabinose dehydrogenase